MGGYPGLVWSVPSAGRPPRARPVFQWNICRCIKSWRHDPKIRSRAAETHTETTCSTEMTSNAGTSTPRPEYHKVRVVGDHARGPVNFYHFGISPRRPLTRTTPTEVGNLPYQRVPTLATDQQGGVSRPGNAKRWVFRGRVYDPGAYYPHGASSVRRVVVRLPQRQIRAGVTLIGPGDERLEAVTTPSSMASATRHKPVRPMGF